LFSSEDFASILKIISMSLFETVVNQASLCRSHLMYSNQCCLIDRASCHLLRELPAICNFEDECGLAMTTARSTTSRTIRKSTTKSFSTQTTSLDHITYVFSGSSCDFLSWSQIHWQRTLYSNALLCRLFS
jgi:hypothetical protein